MVKLSENLVLARSRASDLENVRKLNCWGSLLTDVSIIRQMTNVQVISLSVNQISSLSDFASCPQLEELYIRKNCIGHLSEILHLCALPKLRVLWLADNPCATIEGYRATVLRTLPSLQKLDNIPVQEDEITNALEHGLELHQSNSDDSRLVDGESSEVTCTATDTLIGPEQPQEAEETPVDQTPVSLTWEETNKIRQQLGLRPLPVEKVTPMKPCTSHAAKQRNANILQAVMALIKELDADNLQIVADTIHSKLDMA